MIFVCDIAKKEEKSWKEPKILCGISDCFCKHVEWKDGIWVQTQEAKECPKYTLPEYLARRARKQKDSIRASMIQKLAQRDEES